jgi:DNA polymerase III alpha subunit (gram-positive type)
VKGGQPLPKPNLNTATIAELMTIPGMDAATAFYICRVRQLGKITSFEDLAARLGLSAVLVELLRSESVLEDGQNGWNTNEYRGMVGINMTEAIS